MNKLNIFCFVLTFWLNLAGINTVFGTTLLFIENGQEALIVYDTAETVFNKGVIFYRKNNYKNALAFFEKAYQIADEKNDILLKAKCLERMGSVNLALGNDNLALKLYYEALPFFEITNDKEGIAKVYNIIGLYQSAQNQYDSAEAYYRRAIRLNEEINNWTGLMHNKGNLGYLFEKIGNLNEAEKLYNETVEILIELGDSINLPVVLSNLSAIYLRNKSGNLANQYLSKAIGICIKNNDTSLLARLYEDMGQMYLDQNLFDSASFFIKKSVNYAEAIDDFKTQIRVIKLLVRLDTLKGNYKPATRHLHQLLALNDSLFKRESENNLETSELAYENQKKATQIELQNLHIQSSKRQKQIYLLLLMFSLSTLFLFIVIFILLKKNNLKKSKLLTDQLRIKNIEIDNASKLEEINKLKIERFEEDIKIKEREQVSNALALEQKNELLGMINNKISKAMKVSGVIHISQLNGLVSSIQTELKDSSDSDLFNQKFNLLHAEFFDNLKKIHPELSKSELKFCAYLKLNLTGNQIAKISNITTEAIRKTRYRVRKKLSLDPEVSLEDYISGI